MIPKKREGKRPRFAVCVDPGEYPASLERKKIYEVVPDAEAERHEQLRVIDESGEDYLYPREYFTLVKLSPFLSRLVRAKRKREVSRLGISKRVERISAVRR